MTTVVCDREAMAADTFVSDGGRIQKIHRIGKMLVGISGEVPLALRIIAWLSATKRSRGPFPVPEKEEDRDDVQLLILRKEGIPTLMGHGIEVPHTGPFWAVGSGSGHALGALHKGAALAEAVEIAAVYDSNTKPPVELVYLDPKHHE